MRCCLIVLREILIVAEFFIVAKCNLKIIFRKRAHFRSLIALFRPLVE